MKTIHALALGLGLTTFCAMPAMAQEYYDDTTGNSMSNAPMTNYNSSVDRDMTTGSIDGIGNCGPAANTAQSMNDQNNCRSSKSSDTFNDHPNRTTANDRNNNRGNNN